MRFSMKLFDFLKKNKLVTTLGVTTISTFAALVVSTISWYAAHDITDISIDSGVVAGYFESGDGTSADPYVIARPEHLFNLMQLQQSEKEEGGVQFYKKEMYFALGKEVDGKRLFYSYNDDGVLLNETPNSKTLNMKYYSNQGVLIPIGSEQYPFIGHLDGHNLTVTNLTINGNSQADIGIFGYIAQGTDTTTPNVKNAYFDNVTIDVGVANLTHQNGTTHNAHKHDSNAFVGYIVGHVYDADAALSDVYVNNCKILNQASASAALKNNFGYIGHSDTNSVSPAGSDKSIQLNASSLNTYLSNNYDAIDEEKFAVRNANYTNSTNKTVANAITNPSSGTYTFGEGVTGLGNISLATAGYTMEDSVIRDARYKEGSVFKSLSQNATVLNSVPTSEDIASFDDGAYIYYDSSKNGTTDSKWQYLTVSSTSGEVTTVQMNCYYMTYEDNSTTYYIKYSDGGLVGTTTSPANASASDRPNYYFCLRESAGSTGIRSYSSATDTNTTYHLFSPANNTYVTSTTSGTTNSFSFAQTFSNSLEFSQQGNGAVVAWSGNTQNNALYFYCTGTNVAFRKITANFNNPTRITFKGLNNPDPIPTYDPTYILVTNVSQLSANDVVTFVYEDDDSETGYYAIGVQAKNNRGAVEVALSNHDEGTDNYIKANDATESGFASFVLGGSTGNWTFRDTYTQQYLYAAGTSSSGKNYLRSEDELDSNNWGKWSISVNDTSHAASIVNVGNTYVPNLEYAEGTNADGHYHIFRCYRNAANLGTPLIFKRDSSSATNIYIHDSFVFEVETTSTGIRQTNTYQMYYNNELNEAFSNDSPLLNIQNVTFNLVTSQITFTPQSGGHYERISSYSVDIEEGNYVIAAKVDNTYYAASNSVANSQLNYSSVTTYTSNGKTCISSSNAAGHVFAITQYNDNSITIQLNNDYYLKTTGANTTNLGSQSSTDDTNYSTYWDPSAGTNGTYRLTNEYSTTTRGLIFSSGTGFKNYATSNVTAGGTTYYDLELFKFVADSETLDDNAVYIGDQIGDNYNPAYIDVVGNFSSTSSAMTFANSTGTSVSSSLGSTFYATQFCNKSAVVYVENNHSIDLGRVSISYTQTETNGLALTKGNGTLKTVEYDLSVSDSDEDASGHTNVINLSTNNIGTYAYCAVKITDDNDTPEILTDDTLQIYAYFDASGVAHVSSGTYDASEVDYFILDFKANSGNVSISNISYTFTALPGNSGNFGKVGYRSADYSSSTYTSDKWSQTVPTHATDETILNFFVETAAGKQSYFYVSFDGEHTYDIIAKATVETNMYVFNYDAMIYTVNVNNYPLSGGSSTVVLPPKVYDPENGWAA